MWRPMLPGARRKPRAAVMCPLWVTLLVGVVCSGVTLAVWTATAAAAGQHAPPSRAAPVALEPVARMPTVDDHAPPLVADAHDALRGRGRDVAEDVEGAAPPPEPEVTDPIVAPRAERAPRPPRHLILGMATGLKIEWLARFVTSSRTAVSGVCLADCDGRNTAGGVTDIVIFVDNEDDDMRWLAARFNITFIRVSPALMPGDIGAFHPSSQRWIIFDTWLASLPPARAYDQVFLTDVRDTVLQRDPFAYINVHDPAARGFYAFMETESRKIVRSVLLVHVHPA
ncbi:hypothetical protein EON67_04655 [archaeon]|nr:MAG: hypothetical protein EON67_04655 [archaeon]